MVKQRTADDPWYTVFYRDPHTLWWAPALFCGLALLLIIPLIGGSAEEALVVAGLVGIAACGGA